MKASKSVSIIPSSSPWLLLEYVLSWVWAELEISSIKVGFSVFIENIFVLKLKSFEWKM